MQCWEKKRVGPRDGRGPLEGLEHYSRGSQGSLGSPFPLAFTEAARGNGKARTTGPEDLILCGIYFS